MLPFERAESSWITLCIMSRTKPDNVRKKGEKKSLATGFFFPSSLLKKGQRKFSSPLKSSTTARASKEKPLEEDVEGAE